MPEGLRPRIVTDQHGLDHVLVGDQDIFVARLGQMGSPGTDVGAPVGPVDPALVGLPPVAVVLDDALFVELPQAAPTSIMSMIPLTTRTRVRWARHKPDVPGRVWSVIVMIVALHPL